MKSLSIEKNIAVLIPAYDPESALVSMAQGLIALGFKKLLVVDDGSHKQHKEVFSALTQLNQVSIIHHARNLGKGAALKAGFNFILVNWPDIEVVITADADGQHAPEDVLRVAETSITHPLALVLGVRQFHRNIPWRSYVGNCLTLLVFRLFTGMKVSDTQTGLRAWPKAFCLEALTIDINGYDFEMESLVQAKGRLAEESGIIEVPIRTIYEEGNKSSHFDPIFDSMRIYFVFLRYSGLAIINAITDYLIFLFCFSQTRNLALSQVLGRAATTLLAFILARNVVFNSSAKWQLSLLKYVMLVIASGSLSYGMIHMLHFRLGVNVVAAKLFTEGILFLGNFAVQRDFVFPNTLKAKKALE